MSVGPGHGARDPLANGGPRENDSCDSEMSLLVTGSIGIDTVEAPWGRVVDALGGSSIYFAYAASFFAPVRLVGVVGEDCPDDFLKPLHDNPNIDMSGLEVRPAPRPSAGTAGIRKTSISATPSASS